MVATGLGPVSAKQQLRTPNIALVEPVQVVQRTGTDNVGMQIEHIDYDSLDKTPAVVRRGRAPTTASASGFDPSNIPAFLRKQAD